MGSKFSRRKIWQESRSRQIKCGIRIGVGYSYSYVPNFYIRKMNGVARARRSKFFLDVNFGGNVVPAKLNFLGIPLFGRIVSVGGFTKF